MSQEKLYPPIFTVPSVPRPALERTFRLKLSFIRPALLQARHWAERRRQRRALARLDDRLLEDIGVTRDQAEYEANKPFWQD